LAASATTNRGRSSLKVGRLLLAMTVGAAVVTACSAGGASTTVPNGSSSAAPRTSEAPNVTLAPSEGEGWQEMELVTQAPNVTQSPAGEGADKVDACGLLSWADVKTITGADTMMFRPLSGQADWVAGDCAWFNNADWTSLFDIAVGTPTSIARSPSPTARELYDRVKVATLAGKDEVDIPGLGDAATYGNGILVAIKGGSLVEAFGVPRDQLVEIVKLVLAKL